METTGSHVPASGSRKGVIKNYYEVLQVDPSVTRLQIREAFLRLKRTYGIGSQAIYSLMSEDEARRQMVEIEEAFRILDDDHLRREYDQRLALTGIATGRRETPVKVQEEENIWLGAADLMGENHDGNAVLSKRQPVVKASPRLNETPVKNRVEEILAGADLGCGLVYKQVREASDTSIKQIYEHTKVSPEYIQAIENNDFTRLPALVYVRGFLRTYLQFIGIQNTNDAISSFVEKYRAWESSTNP